VIHDFPCPRARVRVTPRICEARQGLFPEECEACEVGAPFTPERVQPKERRDGVQRVRKDGPRPGEPDGEVQDLSGEEGDADAGGWEEEVDAGDD
jgi:hypothetical protein